MKILIATMSWFALISASNSYAGQHTGVGGNPAPPPPADPRKSIPLALVVPNFSGGVIAVLPEINWPSAKKPSAREKQAAAQVTDCQL
jgi:hypothetical protein